MPEEFAADWLHPFCCGVPELASEYLGNAFVLAEKLLKVSQKAKGKVSEGRVTENTAAVSAVLKSHWAAWARALSHAAAAEGQPFVPQSGLPGLVAGRLPTVALLCGHTGLGLQPEGGAVVRAVTKETPEADQLEVGVYPLTSPTIGHPIKFRFPRIVFAGCDVFLFLSISMRLSVQNSSLLPSFLT